MNETANQLRRTRGRWIRNPALYGLVMVLVFLARVVLVLNWIAFGLVTMLGLAVASNSRRR